MKNLTGTMFIYGIHISSDIEAHSDSMNWTKWRQARVSGVLRQRKLIGIST